MEEVIEQVQQLLAEGLRSGVDEYAWRTNGGVAMLATISEDHWYGGRDLSIAVHGVDADVWQSAVLTIVDGNGNSAASQFNRRGYAYVRRVGVHPWTARVSSSEHPTPQAIMNRVLAAAAAFEVTRSEHVVSSPDGAVTLLVREDDDHHLVAEFVGELEPGDLARFRWRTVNDESEVVDRVLVTPLAPSVRGGVAGYDLGALGSARASELFALEIVPASSVGVAEIDATCHQVWLGSARRAWQGWLSSGGPTNDVVRGLIERATR